MPESSRYDLSPRRGSLRTDKVNSHVRELNAFLRQLAAREKLRVLDFERVLAPDGVARRPEYAADDLGHVTPAGYEALWTYAVEVIMT